MRHRYGPAAAFLVIAGIIAGITAGCGDVPPAGTPTPSSTGSATTVTPSTTPSPTAPRTPQSPTPTPTRTPTRTPTPAPTPTPTPTGHASDSLRVEKKLDALGYPTGTVDGVVTARTRQALCAWRETNGRPGSRTGLTRRDTESILAATTRPAAAKADGIYVSKTCQILYQVVHGSYRRIVRVSTGAPGYDTPNGTGRVWRKWAGWHESSLYGDAWMYDSLYFRPDRPGIALHGSVSNDLVHSYPASHSCVRVWRPEIHQIFLETPAGTPVTVYGTY